MTAGATRHGATKDVVRTIVRLGGVQWRVGTAVIRLCVNVIRLFRRIVSEYCYLQTSPITSNPQSTTGTGANRGYRPRQPNCNVRGRPLSRHAENPRF